MAASTSTSFAELWPAAATIPKPNSRAVMRRASPLAREPQTGDEVLDRGGGEGSQQGRDAAGGVSLYDRRPCFSARFVERASDGAVRVDVDEARRNVTPLHI